MDDCDQISDSQGPEPTNRDIMRMLQTINATLTNKLDSLSDTVERLQGEIFDLQENNKKLTKELEDYRQRETEMKSQVEEAKFDAKLAEQRSNQNEQYSRLWNLKILFNPEKSGKAQDTPEESEKEALHVFHDLLGLRHITPEHLDAVHRGGEKREGRTRPIIVRFVSQKTRLEVLRKWWKLKGSDPKVVIIKDLTRSNYQLFLLASEHLGTLRGWSKDGKIFVQLLDFKIFKIEKLTDLSKLSFHALGSASLSTPLRQCAAFRNDKWTDLFKSGPLEKDQEQTTRKDAIVVDIEAAV